MAIVIRPACASDVPILEKLIEASVRALHTADYTPVQIESALAHIYGVDTQLVRDGTYYVATAERERVVACGGWSGRSTLYGGDRWTRRADTPLDPHVDAAKIRAFFVDPRWARQGIGARILATCESAAAARGFRRFEMGATLSGVAFYSAFGYTIVAGEELVMADGVRLPIVRMEKRR